MNMRGRTVDMTDRPRFGRRLGLFGLLMAVVLVASLAAAGAAFAAARPAVTHVSASSGPTTGGKTVTITGKNFMAHGNNAVKKVMFGQTNATKLHVKSSTRLTVVAPKHAAGTVNVRVENKSGATSAVRSGDHYTYRIPLPAVTGLDPTTGSTVGGNTVTITGTHFTGATAVMFGATAATAVDVVSATSITCTAPAEAAATIEVTVETPAGLSAPSLNNQYAYIAPPAVTALSPATGPAAGGTSVTITGTSLSGATAVMFGATAATDVNVVSATSITCTAPAEAAATVDVTVTTPFGTSTASTADKFIYTP